MSYHYLFDIALILISTKLLGMLTRKFQMPQVVGALLAGLILGPAMLNVLQETDFLMQMAELGVILLMFAAGAETDIKELKKTGKSALLIALLGVIIPLIGGFAVATIFNNGEGAATNVVLQNVFIGIILTATSVSITVETLKEMGKLNTSAGNAILGAAIIDDILGLVGLTIVTSMADSSVNVVVVLFKIAMFFVFAMLVGIMCSKGIDKWMKGYNKDLRRFSVVALVICLMLAFIAEEVFGVADITGAFVAGLIISDTARHHYIESKIEILSYLLLSPIFFASIGIKIVLPEMTPYIVVFASVLLIVAIVSKVVGCGLGAKIGGFSNKESIQIGVGMVSRGEVALIVASKGAAVGLMNPELFGPIVIMVVVTTVLTPIFLKIVFAEKK